MLRHTKIYGGRHVQKTPPVLLFALLVFFFTLADSTGQYVVPLLIQEKGFSDTMIGLIIGFSSLAGGLFDFLIVLFFKNTSFRRLMLGMFAICAVYPLILWGSNTVTLFLFAMAVWGVYYDLYNISTFDFIARYTNSKMHAVGFSRVQIFRSLGVTLAPLLAGLIVLQVGDWRPFQLYWIYISTSILFFLALFAQTRSLPQPEERPTHKDVLKHLKKWRKIARLLLPMLLLTLYLFIIDAFFWTLAPLYAENTSLGSFSGAFLMAYTLPVLLMGWFVGRLVHKYGKNRIAYLCLFIGSSILTLFAFIPNSIFATLLVFCAAIFTSMAMPAINSSYADYIAEDPYEEGEIETIEDLTANVAYVAGPILAGFAADMLGIPFSFTTLGFCGAVLGILLLTFAKGRVSLKA